MKKGQEEIVGFIIIIIIMSVVALVFLGFALRSSDEAVGDSFQARSLLESMLEFTTDCAVGYIPAYGRISELIRECNENSASKCVDGRIICEALNQSLKEMLGKSIAFGEDRPVKGYKFEAKYELGENSDEVISLSSGICLGAVSGAEYPIPSDSGSIITRLEFCG